MNRRAKKKAYLGSRLLFLFVSDRGVSCLRQPHHSARKVVMDWNQVRESLEDDEVSGLRGQSASLRPKKLSFHNTNTATRTADLIGYDSVAGLALFQEKDDLVLLWRWFTCRCASACHEFDPCGRYLP
jgi:hypothetical protein